jgi:hypothetical protein
MAIAFVHQYLREAAATEPQVDAVARPAVP